MAQGKLPQNQAMLQRMADKAKEYKAAKDNIEPVEQQVEAVTPFGLLTEEELTQWREQQEALKDVILG